MKNLTTRRFIGVDGHSYSSIENFKIISFKLNDSKIYERYFRIIRLIKKHICRYKIKYSSKIFKIYERFRNKIEKFCLNIFENLDLTLNFDIFKRLIKDIYFKFNLV